MDASKYFFNYRHASNALAVYTALRRAGVADRQVRPVAAALALHGALCTTLSASPHSESRAPTPVAAARGQIVLMVADDAACDPRNVYRGQLFAEPSHSEDLLRETPSEQGGAGCLAANAVAAPRLPHARTPQNAGR